MTAGRITELAVTKSKTVKAGEREEWIRVEYSVKAAIEADEEVSVAKAKIEGLIDGWLSSVSKPVSPVEKRNVFPTELAGMLTFEDAGEWLIVKPKGFLSAENFAKIADIVKLLGGEYVAAGKNRHFKLPKAAAE